MDCKRPGRCDIVASILARHDASTIVDFGRFGFEPIDPAATPRAEIGRPEV